LVLSFFFLCAFTVIGGRMGLLAMSEPSEPRGYAPGAVISASRADITDRNGNLLATNFQTHALYAQPRHMIDPERRRRNWSKSFPTLKKSV